MVAKLVREHSMLETSSPLSEISMIYWKKNKKAEKAALKTAALQKVEKDPESR